MRMWFVPSRLLHAKALAHVVLAIVLTSILPFEATAQKAPGRPSYRYFFPDTQYHKAYDDDHPAMRGRESEACVQRAPEGYDIAFIEFDERGDFWDREQLAIARRQLTERTAGKIPLLVQYVHGWHHNAQEDSARDVAGFRKLLSFLAQSSHLKGYHVYGVYLGWRGEKIRSGKDPLGRLFWLPSQLSFYPVKRIGNEVGSMPMISEALFWMVREARTAHRSGRSVLIGHSFGAMVLENAIAQAIASSAATSVEGSGSIPAPADLVLLLNSANNSLRAKGVVEMLDRMGSLANDRFEDAERPLIVSITSEGDWATGKFFPLGTGVSNAFRKTRSYKTIGEEDKKLPAGTTQRKFITQTPGHNELLRSHVVDVDEQQIAPSTRQVASGPLARSVFEQNLRNPIAPVRTRHGNVWRFRSPSKSGGISISEIQPYKDALMRTGYWIVRAPKEIIYDHGDIFNEQALAMYAAIYRIANPKSGGVRRLNAPVRSPSSTRKR